MAVIGPQTAALVLVTRCTPRLGRRPAFVPFLAAYGDLLHLSPLPASRRSAPLAWGRAECAERWARGIPLLAEAQPAIRADDLLDLLGIEISPARLKCAMLSHDSLQHVLTDLGATTTAEANA